MEYLALCPSCGSNSISNAFDTNDYFLTHESFRITKCNSCTLLFTNPRPDALDLGKYYQTKQYLSHSTTQNTLLSRVYSFLRYVSIKKKYRLICNYKSNGKILDVGCGTGEFLNYFKQKGWETIGIEPAKNPRDFAVSNYHLQVFDENYISQIKNNTFDIITMWHVLEHVPELNERIKQVKGLLKNDGTLIIALPNYESWDAKYYKKWWAAWDVPRHLYHFSFSSFSKLAEINNLHLLKTLPMKLDSYYVSLLSEKYKTGKTNYFRALFNGFTSNLWAIKNSGNYSSIIFVLKKRETEFKAI